MPFILLGLVVLVGLFGGFLPYELKSFLYAISLTVKSFIIFVLPFIIFGLLFKTSSEMVQKATRMIFVILGAICVSNFVTSIVGGYIGTIVYDLEFDIVRPAENIKLMAPSFDFSLPKLLPNDKAMLLALILGALAGKFVPTFARQISSKFESVIKLILKLIKITIPFFVIGFLVKMQYEGLVLTILENYALIFLAIALVAFVYVSAYYFIASGFIFSKLLTSIKNMLPACIVGFSTMSSAASMPLMIDGSARNSENPNLAKSVIPISVNFHLIGCSISIPIFVFAILKNFGFAEPTLISYLIFACYFVIAKFSVAGVPGGGILVMLPIIESCFGFNSDMLSLITALYILFDPIITTCNILGNGALAMLLSNSKPRNQLK